MVVRINSDRSLYVIFSDLINCTPLRSNNSTANNAQNRLFIVDCISQLDPTPSRFSANEDP